MKRLKMHIDFVTRPYNSTGIMVVSLFEGQSLQGSVLEIDRQTNNFLSHLLTVNKLTGKKGDSAFSVLPAGLPVHEILIIGMGKQTTVTTLDYQEMGGKIYDVLISKKNEKASVDVSQLLGQNFNEEEIAAHAAYGFLLKSWTFEKYKTTKKDEDKPHLKNINFIVNSVEKARKIFLPLQEVAEGVFLTRHVVSEPPNIIYPETLAKTAKELKSLGVDVEILDESDMKKLGMNALLGVGQGSVQDSRMVILSWKGGKSDDKPLAIVGKGVTFDTGGISLKPAQDMDEMKYDMAGSGVVLGLMRALAGRKAKVNVIGIMGLVENMPSGSAQRPGDIVTSLSGQTIEVLNTDAEGRLVLADALWYAQDRFKPQVMVNLATLTGAIVVALGYEHAGLFSNNDALAGQLAASGKTTGEKLWRLPLAKAYDKDIDSDVADVKNIGSGRGAGSITAAQFLQRFVNDVPWAHLDIAGTSWDKKGRPLSAKGATAFGVRLLNHWIQDNYEQE
jgi:leucyl aminopeptidase